MPVTSFSTGTLSTWVSNPFWHQLKYTLLSPFDKGFKLRLGLRVVEQLSFPGSSLGLASRLALSAFQTVIVKWQRVKWPKETLRFENRSFWSQNFTTAISPIIMSTCWALIVRLNHKHVPFLGVTNSQILAVFSTQSTAHQHCIHGSALSHLLVIGIWLGGQGFCFITRKLRLSELPVLHPNNEHPYTCLQFVTPQLAVLATNSPAF